MCCSDVLALPIFKQEEPQLSPENEARLPPLQYVLCAATSPAVKLHEETLTYLNQGSGRHAEPGQSLGAGQTSQQERGGDPDDALGLP